MFFLLPRGGDTGNVAECLMFVDVLWQQCRRTLHHEALSAQADLGHHVCLVQECQEFSEEELGSGWAKRAAEGSWWCFEEARGAEERREVKSRRTLEKEGILLQRYC